MKSIRVAITPSGVHELVQAGHDVVVEQAAGEGSSISDADFSPAGTESPIGQLYNRRRLREIEVDRTFDRLSVMAILNAGLSDALDELPPFERVLAIREFTDGFFKQFG